MLIWSSRIFLFINDENCCVALHFYGNRDFFQDSLISLSLEKSSVINVFTDLINIMHPF